MCGCLGSRLWFVNVLRHRRGATSSQYIRKRMNLLRSERTSCDMVVMRVAKSICQAVASSVAPVLAPQKVSKCAASGHVVDVVNYDVSMQVPTCVQCGQTVGCWDRVRQLKDC